MKEIIKRVSVLFIAVMACASVINAAEEPAPKDPIKWNIYYGTEASTNSDNPCKGATTRICGKIAIQEGFGPGGPVVKKTVVDANGKVIYQTVESKVSKNKK